MSSPLPEAKWLSSDVFLMTWRGEVDHTVAEHGLELIKSQLKERKPQFVVIDASAMTGYKMNVRTAAVACLSELKASGMQRMVAIMPGSPMRMFLSAMATVVGARVSFVATNAEAKKALAELGSRVAL